MDKGGAVNLPLDQADDAQPMMAVLVERPKKSKKKDKKKKKKKKKVGLLVRVIGKVFLGSAAALGQMGEAVSGAADKYSRKHEKSREKRRDGWKKDLGRNLASATSKLLTGSAKAPSKFAKALWKKSKKKKKKGEKDELRTVAVSVQSAPPVDAAPLTTGA
jgi:hypothetical protein